jgi:hypothetical protein
MARKSFAQFVDEVVPTTANRKLYARRIVIEIPDDGDATINYVMERATHVGGNITRELAQNIILPINDTNEYPMLRLSDGTPTGNTIDDKKLEQVLFSKLKAYLASQQSGG